MKSSFDCGILMSHTGIVTIQCIVYTYSTTAKIDSTQIRVTLMQFVQSYKPKN